MAALSVPDDEAPQFFAHLLAAACTVVQATCNPDHRRAPSQYLQPHTVHLLALLQRAVDTVNIDERETLMYAAELVQALREALGGDGNETRATLENEPAVRALRAKIASDTELSASFQEMFGPAEE